MKKTKAPKILITGLHSTPAIALIEEIRKTHPSWKIIYCGPKYAFEGKKILSFDYLVISRMKEVEFVPIVTGRLQRRFTAWTIPSLLKIPWGFLQAFGILIKKRPDILISFGGYVSVPIVISGWFLKTPSLIHEQTQVLGLANRICGFFSRKIAISFPNTLLPRSFSKKVVFTGNLLRDEIFNTKDPGSLREVAQIKQKTRKKIIYVTGGKTGAQAINKLIEGILQELIKEYIVVHQTGALDFERFFRIKKGLGSRSRFYHPVDYLKGEEVGWVLNNSFLVISRAGANIVYELINIGRPAILIPLPKSHQDEQRRNAEYFSSLGLGEIMLQEQTSSESLLEMIKKMSRKIDEYRREFSKIKIVDGRKKMVSLIEEML